MLFFMDISCPSRISLEQECLEHMFKDYKSLYYYLIKNHLIIIYVYELH